MRIPATRSGRAEAHWEELRRVLRAHRRGLRVNGRPPAYGTLYGALHEKHGDVLRWMREIEQESARPTRKARE